MPDEVVILLLCLASGMYFLVIEPAWQRWYAARTRQRAGWLQGPTRQPEPDSPVVPASGSVRVLPEHAWLRLVNQQPDTLPHLLIAGQSGSGKTTLCKAIR